MHDLFVGLFIVDLIFFHIKCTASLKKKMFIFYDALVNKLLYCVSVFTWYVKFIA